MSKPFVSEVSKYKRGVNIRSMGQLSFWLEWGNHVYVKYDNKYMFQHCGWMSSMQFRSLMNLVNSGKLFYAIENNEFIIEEQADERMRSEKGD